MIVLQFLIGLLGLGIMVLIHEAGHFFAARALGIKVEAFSIGWGPKLFSFKRNETEYLLSAIPLGGYCKMKGEEDMVAALSLNKRVLEASEGSFYAAKPWRRILVAFAGPAVNFIFAVLTLSVIWYLGFTYASTESRIVVLSDYPELLAPEASNSSQDVLKTEQSPAAAAGLKTGDRIVAINGQKTESFRDLQSLIALSARSEMSLDIVRDDRRFQVTVNPVLDTQTGAGKIGILQWIEPIVEAVLGAAASSGLQKGDRIMRLDGVEIRHALEISKVLLSPKSSYTVDYERKGETFQTAIVPDYGKDGTPFLNLQFSSKTFYTEKLNVFQALGKGLSESFNTLWVSIRSLGHLFSGLDPSKALSGPLRITYFVGEIATQGFSVSVAEGFRSFFSFLSLISIALFFGNLLPIPALDGGQILLFAWEGITKQPLRPRFIQRYQVVGLVMVILLSVFALFGDILFFTGR